jgi:hypothetical protein
LATAIVFRDGRFPDSFYELLNAEGIALLQEDVKIAITYRRHGRKRTMRGAIAVTERRLAVWGAPGKQIDVPFADPKFAALEFSADLDDGLLIAFDASALDANQSGRVEMRLRVADAERVAQTLR